MGLQLDRVGLGGLAEAIGRMTDVAWFERCAGNILGARVAVFCMEPSYGALDVDDERELEVYRMHDREFRALVASHLAAAGAAAARCRRGEP